MATNLALPGALFVGEDDRGRLVAQLGPAAGWMIPHGVLGWSTEVSVVARDAITDSVKSSAKIVMPEEQIPTGKYPLAHQAALKAPLVAVSSKLTQKLVDAGIRVHTVGADRVTSSFYYLAEGGGEEPIRVEGDLVAAVGAMLGERADNAAIERVLDGLVDRLVRSLSKDRVTELSLELAHALPRAAADGSGLNDIDLDGFEKELSGLVGGSEKYTPYLQEIATKIAATNDRKVDIPLFGDAKKVSQGPFELEVGSKKVALVTHERWLATGPLTEPKPGAKPAAAAPPPAAKTPEAKPPSTKTPEPKPAAAAPAAKTPEPKKASPKPAPVAAAATAKPVEKTALMPQVEAKPAAEPQKTALMPEVKAPEPTKSPEPAKTTAPMPEVKPAEPAKPAEKTLESAKVEAAPAPAEAAPKTKTVPLKESTPAAEAAPIPKAASTPKAAQPIAKAEANPRDQKLATTAKIPKKEKGFPWLWIAVAVAAAFAGYRFWAGRQK